MAKSNKAIVNSLRVKLADCEKRLVNTNDILAKARTQSVKDMFQPQAYLLGIQITTLKSILGK